MSSTPARRGPLTPWIAALVVALAAGGGYYAGVRAGAVRDVLSAAPAEAQRIAFVREAPCDAGRCQTLWVGTAYEDAGEVAALSGRGERVEAIAWSDDGYRVGFVVNGYQLWVFDPDSRTEVARVDLIEPSGTPSARIARGITFSTNGAAVTFDDCPRYHSGCRSGLMAIR